MRKEQVLERALKYYAKDGNSCGGSLHIVLDDGNIDDDCVHFCREVAQKRGDSDGVDLCNALLTITESMRHDLYCELHGIPWYPQEEE